MGRFIIKHIYNTKPQMQVFRKEESTHKEEKVEEKIESVKQASVKENKIKENKSVMTTEEKIELANAVLQNSPVSTKRIKKDKGLIERAESSKTILTEDNKELLND